MLVNAQLWRIECVHEYTHAKYLNEIKKLLHGNSENKISINLTVAIYLDDDTSLFTHTKGNIRCKKTPNKN